ncbi:Gfo/Idh/MocA family protein [Microbacterium stercoris]|uniref:Gfo/Idh/MocA family oxidoreductase n=1 Tax=Microbacterium stercoris TaxID=2820289 RepID=A0A939TRP5_9MICO|nr:Gfo/Idh/MocA family oxidoreductase [Microbacterium stercoris]MBO3662374.1 Gfo/Idh/MocA family oxidoreductase [Microbacterium stercoris]MBO3664366.1 Gfo/Idh/MocA family oxidoreductase [Microbacterium stercoris]
MESKTPGTFAIVGDGYRAGLIARVVSRLTPGALRLTGLATRRPERVPGLEAEYGVRVWSDVDALAAECDADFVFVAVQGDKAPDVVAQLVAAGKPVLVETPPAPDVPGLVGLHELVGRGAVIQVAEQYHLEPLVSAQLAVGASGLLGDVKQADIAIAHEYHGISVLRRALGVGFEPVTIRALRHLAPVVWGPDRAGDPQRERVATSSRTLAWLEWGERLGVYDFDDQQYRSWVRTPRVQLRGSHGELRDTTVRRQADGAPVRSEITRLDAGGPHNHEGMHFRGYQLDGRWLERNELAPARLAEDEIGIARALLGMRDHVHGGAPIYSLADAAQDHYLGLLIREAVATGEPVRSERMPWAH